MQILNSYIEPPPKRDRPLDDLILQTLRYHCEYPEAFDDEGFIADCAEEMIRLIQESDDMNSRGAIELALGCSEIPAPRKARE